MICTCKNLNIICVKFSGKIVPTLVADLTYVIVRHLKSVSRTLISAHWLKKQLKAQRTWLSNWILQAIYSEH